MSLYPSYVNKENKEIVHLVVISKTFIHVDYSYSKRVSLTPANGFKKVSVSISIIIYYQLI
jgi:hypothetical protein